MDNTAILLLNCPDQKGIVATVASFLYKHNANILHSDEHQDAQENLFFLRTEWDLTNFQLSKEAFCEAFGVIAKQFHMDWKVIYPENKTRIALLVSREDHCLADLLYRHKSGELHGEIVSVISNHGNAKPLAEFYGIPFYEFPVTPENKQSAEKKILKVLIENNVNLVVLARYMQILSSEFITEFGHPIINIHHSFLPAFVGAKPYHQAYARGVKVIGATAHYVTADLDQGPIIEQDVLRVTHRESVENLVQKGRDIEKNVLSKAIKWHLQNRVLVYKNKTVVFD